MAPTTTQNSQRMDKIEEDIAAIKSSISTEIAQAVAKAMQEVTASLEGKLNLAVAKIEEKMGSSKEMGQNHNQEGRKGGHGDFAAGGAGASGSGGGPGFGALDASGAGSDSGPDLEITGGMAAESVDIGCCKGGSRSCANNSPQVVWQRGSTEHCGSGGCPASNVTKRMALEVAVGGCLWGGVREMAWNFPEDVQQPKGTYVEGKKNLEAAERRIDSRDYQLENLEVLGHFIGPLIGLPIFQPIFPFISIHKGADNWWTSTLFYDVKGQLVGLPSFRSNLLSLNSQNVHASLIFNERRDFPGPLNSQPHSFLFSNPNTIPHFSTLFTPHIFYHLFQPNHPFYNSPQQVKHHSPFSTQVHLLIFHDPYLHFPTITPITLYLTLATVVCCEGRTRSANYYPP